MINLPGGYAMDADDYCYIIGKPYRSPKDGKITLAKKTYYTKMEDAIKDVVARCTRDGVASGEISDLHTLWNYFQQATAEIGHLLSGVTVTNPSSTAPVDDSVDEA